MWWRSIDWGSEPGTLPPASASRSPAGTITAESWCRDQPVALVMREVEKAAFIVKGH